MSEILDFQAGREARITGCVRDRRRSADWIRGWDQEQRDIERHMDCYQYGTVPTPEHRDSKGDEG